MPFAARLRPPPDGLERFDPGRDLPAVIDLLREGFKDELALRDHRWLADLQSASAAGPLLSLVFNLVPAALSGLTGYVWYDAGRLVGNASVMHTSVDAWVVANVVTRPDYRRRGIARALMRHIIDQARRRGARSVQLQVRRGNQAAQGLYDGLGFRRIGARAYLRLASVAAAAPCGRTPEDWALVTWSAAEEQRARRLVHRAHGGHRLAAPGLVKLDLDRLGWRGRLDDWLHGRVTGRWAAQEGDEFRAVAVARGVTDGGQHELEVVTDPAWRGRAEPLLVDACLAALSTAPDAAVEADIDADESGALAALEAAGFTEQRTLELLTYDVA